MVAPPRPAPFFLQTFLVDIDDDDAGIDASRHGQLQARGRRRSPRGCRRTGMRYQLARVPDEISTTTSPSALRTRCFFTRLP